MTDPAYRFCPSCGGALESRSLKDGDPPRLVCSACGFIFYLDPKVAVGTIIRAPANSTSATLPRRSIQVTPST